MSRVLHVAVVLDKSKSRDLILKKRKVGPMRVRTKIQPKILW